ncbi:MAG: hypothetical protein ACM3SV_03925 [Betaproteobacteria bacterium]
MKTFTYNDITFGVEKAGDGYDITKGAAVVAAGLFKGVAAAEAEAKAEALVKTIYPVGIKSVPPDVTHPTMIGDLKIVPPDVGHSTFIYWNKDSVNQAY